MSEAKLTAEQVRHECRKIDDEYSDAKAVIKAKRDKKIEAIQDRCPHMGRVEDP